MLPFRYQLLGHFALTFCLAVSLSFAIGGERPTAADKSRPYVTHPDMLAVTVLARRDGPPEILEVRPLAEGRVSVAQPGDYMLVLQNEHGESIYQLSFRVGFTIHGWHGELDENQLIFVLPRHGQATQLLLSSPHGRDVYDLSLVPTPPMVGDVP
jgi:hypothetical protein